MLGATFFASEVHRRMKEKVGGASGVGQASGG